MFKKSNKCYLSILTTCFLKCNMLKADLSFWLKDCNVSEVDCFTIFQQEIGLVTQRNQDTDHVTGVFDQYMLFDNVSTKFQ
jgi:hypothetical protein